MRNAGLLGRVAIGGLLGIGVFLVVMFAPSPFVALLVAAWSVLATLEFLRLLRIAEIELDRMLIPALNALIVAAAWLGWLPEFLVVPIAVVFIVPVLIRNARPRVPVYGVFTILYLGFVPAHLVLLNQLRYAHDLSPWMVVFPLLLTWTNDTAAWGIGRMIGRHKLAPRVSPKKTWEGFAAGLVASALLAALFLHRFAPLAGRPWFYLAIVGVGLGTLSQIGDLFESIFKRAVDIKDSSDALGDHGGFLDRVDSLLFTIPAWYYLLWLYLS